MGGRNNLPVPPFAYTLKTGAPSALQDPMPGHSRQQPDTHPPAGMSSPESNRSRAAPTKTRSRGGCANCKRRKRKCDQTRPACLQCQRRRTSCEGYAVQLQWDWGVASRGTLARAKLPVAPSTCTADLAALAGTPPSVASTSPGDGRDADSVQSGQVWDFESDECRRLFAKFLHSGLHTLYSTSTNSWIKDMMAQLSTESTAMLAACVALQLLQDPRDRAERFHFCFEKALKVFGDELLLGGGHIRRGTLCAGLLLCTISIDQGIPWTNHIQCMVDLYGLRDTVPPSCVADPYVSHLLEVMGVMDMPRLVLGRQTPSVGIWSRARRAQELMRRQSGVHMARDEGVELATGVPRTLLDILARPDDDSTIERELWQWEGCEGEFLQAHLWNAWRYAGILLVRRNRRRGASAAGHHAGHQWAPASSHLLWHLVAALDALRLGIHQKENAHLLVANGMLFPFMVASSETALLRKHPAWLGPLRLDTDLSPIWAHKFQTTSKILGEIWGRGDASLAHEELCDMNKACEDIGVELALF